MRESPRAVAAMRDEAALLVRAGLPPDSAFAFLDASPPLQGDFQHDVAAFTKYWQTGAALRARLPAKPARHADEAAACDLILREERKARESFLTAHVDGLYRRLTKDRSRFVRAEQLVYDAAALVPGLVPTQEAVRHEAGQKLKGKEGFEIDQGIFLSHVFAHAASGRHLCHAMLLPRRESAERLAHLVEHGSIDLGAAAVSRIGRASVVEMRHPRFLNALDDTTLDAIETAVDVAILDPATGVAVLRGGLVEHPKYAGRRVFSAGINLTHLYHGQISYLFYIKHILGFENKILRGLAQPELPPDEATRSTTEKPWIAAVDAFAIGGGCQHLLVMDYVLAGSDAYLTLPARKEGIIPGASNLRLPRFVGDRAARQAILSGREWIAGEPDAELLCDEVVTAAEFDGALAKRIAALTDSGLVNAIANRRAIRIGQEPLELYREYMALYSREQAYCHQSPQLVSNLERNWNAHNRVA